MLYRSHQTQPANRWQIFKIIRRLAFGLSIFKLRADWNTLSYLAFWLVQHVGATINSAQTGKGLPQHAEFQFIMKLLNSYIVLVDLL